MAINKDGDGTLKRMAEHCKNEFVGGPAAGMAMGVAVGVAAGDAGLGVAIGAALAAAAGATLRRNRKREE